MAAIVHQSKPVKQNKAPNEKTVLADPLKLEDQPKGPLISRLIPAVMGLMMVGFIVLLVMSGTRMMSPYMLMAPLGMLMGAMAYMAVGGAGGGSLGDLDTKRKEFYLQLRELRKRVHRNGAYVHKVQTTAFPHHDTLLSRVGTKDMWKFKDSKAKQGTTAGHTEEDGSALPALNPFMSARIGVGKVELKPEVKHSEPDIPEVLEPLTAGAWRRFLRIHKVVTNCPIGQGLNEHPAYSFLGDPEAILGLARAMIVSLAYNHSPNDLAIGIVTDDPYGWDWIKWLPHIQDRSRGDHAGTARLAWRSLDEFAASTNASVPSGAKAQNMIVFVDTPNAEAVRPHTNWPPADNITIVVLRSLAESLTEIDARFHVSSEREFSTPRRKNLAYADSVTVDQARTIAQKMSRWRPSGWSSDVIEVIDTGRKRSFFDVLGISDISSFDPRADWKRNALDSQFDTPIGFVADWENGDVSDELCMLNFAESSQGGTGPHGSFQGYSGTGKSFLLAGVVLSMCRKFGPDKVTFILMDFKGGTAFNGFEDLPHVIESITNLDKEAELVDRTGEVIEGEIIRREEMLRELKFDSWVEWRKAWARQPHKYPQPPAEIFIFVDEFREFMVTHKEKNYLRLFSRVTAVGRALGIHIIPSSQYIDSVLLGDMMENLMFGGSLATTTPQRSLTVLIDTPAAKDLPSGQGAAIIRRDVGERLTRFVGFNVKEDYVGAPKDAGPQKNALTSGTAKKAILQPFTLANQFDAALEAPTVDKTPTGPSPELIHPVMKDVLVERLSQFRDIVAPDLWKPSLRAPISLADIELPESPRSSGPLQFRLGDTDAPRLAARLPYCINPEGGYAHIRILGRAQSGRTTVVQSMIAAAQMAYSPRFCSFYLIDYGGAKLAESAAMPNVGGYARRMDTDLIDRFIGEFYRVLAIREREFGKRNVTDLAEYFDSRGENPVDGDAYGHMFLVVDGFASYVDEKKEVSPDTPLLRLVRDGTPYGLHLVVTSDNADRIPFKMREYFGTTINLRVEDVNAAGIAILTPASKQLVKDVPFGQPGRCVDFSRELAARIVVPQRATIEATGEDGGQPTYDHYASYRTGIQAFVEEMKSTTSERAEQIMAAPEVIDHAVVWDIYEESVKKNPPVNEDGHRTSLDKHIPIGVSCEDLRIVCAPDRSSPHLLAIGDVGSGKTSFLRGHINSIIRQFTAEEAQFVIIENQYKLHYEQEQLDNYGYLLGYASTPSQIEAALAKVTELISPRTPTEDTRLTSAQVRNRTWYQGPEVYVLIDNATNFVQGMTWPTKLDPLLKLMEDRNDLGLHVYATGQARGFNSIRESNKLYKAMALSNTATLLFSGPYDAGTIWPGTGIRFASRRPGQAALVEDPSGGTPEAIQTPLARPWDDDLQQPQQ